MTLEKHIDAIKKLGYEVSISIKKDTLKEVHAGYHPVTGKAFTCADIDLPPMTWIKVQEYIKEHHPGWRLPKIPELRVMYENRETINGFKTASGSDYAYWYWSCTEHRDDASRVYAVDFTVGQVGWFCKDYGSLSSRLVRMEL